MMCELSVHRSCNLSQVTTTMQQIHCRPPGINKHEFYFCNKKTEKMNNNPATHVMHACMTTECAGVPAVRDDGRRGGDLRDAAGAQHHDQPGGAGDQAEPGGGGAGQPRRGPPLLPALRPQVLALPAPRLHARPRQQQPQRIHQQVDPSIHAASCCVDNATRRCMR